MGGTVSVKSQAPSRIPLMFSTSNAGAIILKAIGIKQAWKRWSQRDPAFHSVTSLSPQARARGTLTVPASQFQATPAWVCYYHDPT